MERIIDIITVGNQTLPLEDFLSIGEEPTSIMWVNQKPFQMLIPPFVADIQQLQKKGILSTNREVAEALLEKQAEKDPGTVYHQRRVELIAREVGRVLGYEGENLEEVSLAGLLHDVGKVGIPEDVLKKNGQLTDDEYAVIKTHPLLSRVITHILHFPDKVVAAVAQHHKGPFGQGYPISVRSEDIILEGQIVRIADGIDTAATPSSERGYPKEVKSVRAIGYDLLAGTRKGKYTGDVFGAALKAYKKNPGLWEQIQMIGALDAKVVV